jgi:hypothetical protein
MSSFNFDPAAFLDIQVNETFERRPPLPVKDYPAIIQDLQARQWTSKDKYNDDGTPKQGIAYDVTLSLQIPLDVKEELGLTKDDFTMKDSIMLDLNAQNGLATEAGSNRQLRAYREALGMNVKGQPFSPRSMVGRMLLVRIKHEEWQGAIQERVAGVARLP